MTRSINSKSPMLFAGSSHQKLGGEIAALLGTSLGKISLGRFPDGEIAVQILEDVKGRDVLVLQSTAIDPSFYLLELLIMIDALKRASAQNITAIIPYFGFSRQDRKDKPGEPITAKLIANLLSIAGINRLVTVDLHADQLEGFFEIPVDHLHCQDLLVHEAQKILGSELMTVAPDIGSIKIVKKIASTLHSDFVVIEKERHSADNVKMMLIGNLTAKNVLIADDICSTGSTLISAANLCRDHGAKKMIGAVTHGICCSDAIEKIESSLLDAVIITNTIPSFDRFANSTKFRIVSIAPMIANHLRLKS